MFESLRLKAPRTCPICLKELPKNQPNKITFDGKGVHVECLSKLMKELKPHE